MNKARIILSAVAFFAVIGGALAFKAMRNGNPVFTTTQTISTFGTLYSTTAVGDIVCWSKTNQFFTVPPAGQSAPDLLTTTAPATLKITLRRVGGTPAQTITVPNYCTVTALTTTNTTAVE